MTNENEDIENAAHEAKVCARALEIFQNHASAQKTAEEQELEFEALNRVCDALSELWRIER